MAVVNDVFFDEVVKGLTRTPKGLSPKWLYDDRGSELFEDITQVPEYYPTRTEAAIFKTVFPQLKDILPAGGAIAEYGSGASVKTIGLIEALAPSVYVPIDIAADFLQDAADTLQEKFPAVDVKPEVADFTQPIELPEAFHAHECRLGFFPGSTIGNLAPEAANRFLQRARTALGDGAYFLLGADLVKDTPILEAAYDDAGGVTAAFNMNLLTRMNRELGADFDLSAFAHRAVFNEAAARIEMHLVSLRDQCVAIGEQRFDFREGETIHTENSHKFTVDSLEDLARSGGWKLKTLWTDPKDWFGVFLLENA